MEYNSNLTIDEFITFIICVIVIVSLGYLITKAIFNMTNFIRVFPRKTNATPTDDNVRFDHPGLFDTPKDVHVSVTFTWDKPKAEFLANAWSKFGSNVTIGGAAYDDPGDEFTPGLYIKEGYLFTSRGCPNNCWFCSVPKREGKIRELEIKKGYNILDSNLLACSDQHIKKVFNMLKNQKEKARFTSGLDTKFLKEWHVEEIKNLKPGIVYVAYDTPDDYEPLIKASEIFNRYEMINKSKFIRCYVLIGWKNDTLEKANERLEKVAKLGIMPMAMLYNHGEERINDKKEWIKFNRTWANPFIVASKTQKIYSY